MGSEHATKKLTDEWIDIMMDAYLTNQSFQVTLKEREDDKFMKEIDAVPLSPPSPVSSPISEESGKRRNLGDSSETYAQNSIYVFLAAFLLLLVLFYVFVRWVRAWTKRESSSKPFKPHGNSL